MATMRNTAIRWYRKVFGAPAEVMVAGFGKLEADIWSIAKKVLTQTQQEELRAVILEWRRKNPAKIRVNFIRFSDFGGPHDDRQRQSEDDCACCHFGNDLGCGHVGWRVCLRAALLGRNA